MASKHKDFIEDAEGVINNSEWLLEECDKIFDEFKNADMDSADVEYLDNLLSRMNYLQGKINAEKSIYENFCKKHQDYM